MTTDPAPPSGLSAILVDKCHRVLEDHLDQFTRMVTAAPVGGDEEAAAWVRGQPHRNRKALEKVRCAGFQVAVILVGSVVDHVEMLAHALDKPDGKVRVWAYMTLARAAVEAATRVSFLLDADVDPQMRILRGAAAVAGGRRDELVLAGEFADDDGGAGVEQVQQLLSGVDDDLKKAGIGYKLGRDEKPTGVTRGGVSAPFNINVTEEAKRRLPGTVAPYRLGSAVTHGAWWFLGSSVDRSGGAFRAVPEKQTIVNAVVLALASLETVAAVFVRDADAVAEFHKKTKQRIHIALKWGG